MFGLVRLLSGVLFTVAFCHAQLGGGIVVPGEELADLEIPVGSVDRIAYFAPFQDGYLVATAPRRIGPADAFQLFAVDRKGERRYLESPGRLLPRQPISTDGRWIFVGATTGSLRGQPYLLDASTNTTRVIPSEGRVYSGVVADDRLVLLTDGGGKGRLSVYDCQDLTLTATAEVDLWPWGGLLSRAGAHEILAIDCIGGAYARISLAPELSVGRMVELSGAEVRKAMQHARSVLSAAPAPTGSSGIRVPAIIAHLTTRSGTDLFLLQPHDRKRGFRLVEYDPAGRQRTIYRFRCGADREALAKLRVSQGLWGTTEDAILLLGQDGVVREFERP